MSPELRWFLQGILAGLGGQLLALGTTLLMVALDQEDLWPWRLCLLSFCAVAVLAFVHSELSEGDS